MSHLVPIQITLQAANAADARQLVQDLAGTLSGMSHSDIPANTEVSATLPETASRKQNTTQKKDESAGEPIDINEVPDGEIPSVVDLRAKAQEVGKSPEGKKAVKALLNKFNSPSISDVPEDKRVAFMAELEKLL